MKKLFYFAISLATVACQTPQATTPVPSTPVAPLPVAVKESVGQFPNIPLNTILNDLPTVSPESVQYRVSVLELTGTTDNSTGLRVRFSYNQQNQLAYTDFNDYSGGRAWRHNYTYDATNRLIREESDTFIRTSTGEYNPVRIYYSYEGDKLVKISRNTLGDANYGSPIPNLVTLYRYEGNRRTEATILNYYLSAAVANVPYPVDSTRRRFAYTDNDRTITEQDSVWFVPCYPNIPCINQFSRVNQTRKQVDAKANLLLVETSVFSSLYPTGKATFTNEYNGPDGLLSQRVNESAGLVYRFSYEKK